MSTKKELELFSPPVGRGPFLNSFVVWIEERHHHSLLIDLF
jgi:hypothetical protein